MEESFSNDSAIIKRQTNVMLTECRICAAPALYSYFGVISCHACKMFFKRNAEQRQKTLKCISNGNCDINLAKRHVCSYCRLVKCFKTGMQIKMIRSSQPKTNRKRRLISGRSTQTTERALIPSNQLGQISTLSLLQCDSSRLTIEQWNLLSNISHCYDEYNGFSKCERFMFDQNVLPIKLRFKCSSMIKLIQICVGESQLVYKHNMDFYHYLQMIDQFYLKIHFHILEVF